MNAVIGCTFVAIAGAAVALEVAPAVYTGSVTVKLGLAAIALAALAQADKYF